MTQFGYKRSRTELLFKGWVFVFLVAIRSRRRANTAYFVSLGRYHEDKDYTSEPSAHPATLLLYD